MAIQEVTVNTGNLSKDIEELKQVLGTTRRQLEEMFQQVTELDAMWDGPSNAEFVAQFHNDYENAKELCHVVSSIIQCMEYAREQYNICESEVHEIVASINV